MAVIYRIIQQDCEELESDHTDGGGDDDIMLMLSSTVMVSSAACDMSLPLLVYVINSRHCLVRLFVCLDVRFQDTQLLLLLNCERQKAGVAVYTLHTVLSFSLLLFVLWLLP